MIPHVLSIAGSDPSGGAGIQADLKTFSALGAYGMAALTALTAQNTTGVSGVHFVPPDFVRQQVSAVLADIRVDAIKIGMAGEASTVQALAALLRDRAVRNLVLDPVMVAQSGDRLASDETVAALKNDLMPLAHIVTPNLPEAAVLTGDSDVADDIEAAAERIFDLGARAVLIKGGHQSGGNLVRDYYLDADGGQWFEALRVPTRNNHGTGCTLSSAIAVFMARGLGPRQACEAAKSYVTRALQHADDLAIGHGAGPVHHFFAQWTKTG